MQTGLGKGLVSPHHMKSTVLSNQNALNYWLIRTKLTLFVAHVWKVQGVNLQEKPSDGSWHAAKKAQVNMRCQKGDMQKVSCCDPQNIRCPHLKFRIPCDLYPEILCLWCVRVTTEKLFHMGIINWSYMQTHCFIINPCQVVGKEGGGCSWSKTGIECRIRGACNATCRHVWR